MRLRTCCAALVLLWCGPLTAQEPGAPQDTSISRPGPRGVSASTSLPSGHWSGRAIRRLAAVGLLHDDPLPQRIRTVAVVRTLLARAEERASGHAPALAPLISRWQDQLRAEYRLPEPGAAPYANHALGLAGRELGAAGLEDPVAPDPRVLPPEEDRDLVLLPSLQVGYAPHLAAAVHLAGGTEKMVLHRGEVEIALGRTGLSASLGREAVGYGWAVGGGVTLTGAAPLDRLEVETPAALRLPGVLAYLGPFSFHTALGRATGEAPVPQDAWLWSGALAAQPHSRVTLAVYRAALFGPEGSDRPLAPRRLLGLLLGEYQDDTSFENQVLSLEARLRLPTERLLPLQGYVEWGADDGAGGLDEAPGVVAGLYAPFIPGLPQLAAGIEGAYFGVRCCRPGGLLWYNHGNLPLVAGPAPLAHGLGGNGREWLLYVQGDFAGGRLGVDTRAFLRDREAGTVYGGVRAGRSRGLSTRASAWLGGRLRLELVAERESGEGWSTRRAELAGVAFF